MQTGVQSSKVDELRAAKACKQIACDSSTKSGRKIPQVDREALVYRGTAHLTKDAQKALFYHAICSRQLPLDAPWRREDPNAQPRTVTTALDQHLLLPEQSNRRNRVPAAGLLDDSPVDVRRANRFVR